MKARPIQQARLTIEREDGAVTTMTTWLDVHPKLAVGKFVTLKGDFRRWKVEHLSEAHVASEIKKTFDNNDYSKHKGLLRDRTTE